MHRGHLIRTPDFFTLQTPCWLQATIGQATDGSEIFQLQNKRFQLPRWLGHRLCQGCQRRVRPRHVQPRQELAQMRVLLQHARHRGLVLCLCPRALQHAPRGIEFRCRARLHTGTQVVDGFAVEHVLPTNDPRQPSTHPRRKLPCDRDLAALSPAVEFGRGILRDVKQPLRATE